VKHDSPITPILLLAPVTGTNERNIGDSISLRFPFAYLATAESKEVRMERRRVIYYLVVLFLSLITLFGCQGLVPHDTPSLLSPKFQRSEVVGIVAGFGTTFAAVPDLVAMIKRRSSVGMNPRMAAITGVFQVLWVYYGLLILSRPVIAWNVVAVFINFLSVGAYLYFVRKEKAEPKRVLGS
jgi:MtN3 and saliva related transmembrane protein